MEPVVFYGAGHLGRQIHHHVRQYYAGSAEILGFIDDTRDAGIPVVDGHGTIGTLEDAIRSESLGPGAARLVFAIGYASMRARRAALDRAVQAGYELFTVLHPGALIEPTARPAAGSVILAGAVLDQDVRLGPACFVDIGVRLGAGTIAGTNNYFSSGTSTGSRVVIGDDSFFGMDCTITTEVELGSNLFINAKSLVARDLKDQTKLVELHKSREIPHRD